VQLGAAAQLRQKLDAVHAGHIQIEQNHFGQRPQGFGAVAAEQQVKGFFAIEGRVQLVGHAELGEGFFRRHGVKYVVFN